MHSIGRRSAFLVGPEHEVPIIKADAKPSCGASVLDLPQLYKRPTSADLLATLNELQVKPSSWDDAEESPKYGVDEEGLPNYLTSIIASSLAWIPNNDVKEQIWEAASTRLSERSGRSGSSQWPQHQRVQCL